MRRRERCLAVLMGAVVLAGSVTACKSQPIETSAPGTAAGSETDTQKDTKAASLYTPGIYSAEVTGMKEMTVTVTFTADAITAIELDHQETPGIGEPVCEFLPNQIIELQGLGIDAVAGATLSSMAILEGVADCVEQAGGDVAALRAVKSETAENGEEELTADVVVIGAGGAGMAAAITANQEGRSVIIIEKTGSMGGNTALAGGALNAVEDGSETALVRNDSVALHYEQTFNGGDQQGNPKLVHTLVENAWDGIEWLKELGMEFESGVFSVTGGMYERAHKPAEPQGSGFFNTYRAYMEKYEGILIKYRTTAEKFIVENGVVAGVECTGETGNKVIIRAKNGIVLATGGFGQNIEMREKYNEETKLWPALDENILSTNIAAATGDGIRMAQEIGADLIQMGNIQLLPLGDPATGSLSGNIEHTVESRIFVNQEGKRFVNEGGYCDEMTLSLFEQPNAVMYIIMDSDTYPNGDEKNNFNEKISDLVAEGRVYRADTLEELAEMIHVPAQNLVQSVEEYNRHCLGGDLESQADEFGRVLFIDGDKRNNGINNGPFYAAERVPTVHHTMGGVKINDAAQVINTQGNAIPGLFAAGEVTGGIHGNNRLGGNALTDTVVFGRIAGKSASDYTR